MYTVMAKGDDHTCAIATDGDTYCWGGGALGSLGDGLLRSWNYPVKVIGGHRFVTLAAGEYQSCGATADGTAYCWGHNFSGQLGTGSFATEARPPRHGYGWGGEAAAGR